MDEDGRVESYDELVERFEEGVVEHYNEYGELDYDDLYDIIDRVMPIYNYVLLTVARSNLRLVNIKVEVWENGISVSNLLQRAIQDELFIIGSNMIDEIHQNGHFRGEP